jgi:hypothetical protein
MAAMVEEASGGRLGAYVLTSFLCGETIDRGLTISRPGDPTSALG